MALVKELLYNRRYTIEGVQKLFKNRSVKDILGTEIQKDFFEEEETAMPEEMPAAVTSAVAELRQIKAELEVLAAAE